MCLISDVQVGAKYEHNPIIIIGFFVPGCIHSIKCSLNQKWTSIYKVSVKYLCV